MDNCFAPRNDVRACFEKDSRLQNLNTIDDDSWEESRDLVHLEIWKYDPVPISNGDAVDIISMALSLENNRDERVQGELQDVMEERGWQ